MHTISADRVVVVATDPHLQPSLLVAAILNEASTAPHRAGYVEVLLPAVLPPTLPITAMPPRLAARLERLRAFVREMLDSSRVPGAVAIVPCRSTVALLGAVDRVDRLVLVGSTRWSVRRAARQVADEVVVLSPRTARRNTAAAVSSRPAQGSVAR